MKSFAALLTMQDEEKSAHYRPQHLEYLDKMKGAGKVWAYGRFGDGSGGMVIYRAETAAEARGLAEADPYVSTGARRLEVREWMVVTDARIP